LQSAGVTFQQGHILHAQNHRLPTRAAPLRSYHGFSMWKRYAAVAFFALCCGACQAPEENRVKAIIGAVLIDGAGGPPLTNSIIIVAGNRFREVGSRSNILVPQGADTIDGSGKTIVPGLIDVYARVPEPLEPNLNSFLDLGIVALCNSGGNPDFVARQAERDGRLMTTRLLTAGNSFAPPGGISEKSPGVFQPATVEQASAEVAELARMKVDAIHIFMEDSGRAPSKAWREIAAAVLEGARSAGIPSVGHISRQADAEFLVDNGVSGLIGAISDAELDPTLLTRLRDLRVFFAPVLTQSSSDPAELSAEERNVRSIFTAGAPIAVSSGGGSAPDYQRQLELLAQAGVPPMDVIAAATRNGAVALGQSEEFGTIQPGKRADFLILTANAGADVRNLQKIDRLMFDGEWVDRARLRR
jgi:imidazolonepropionase-like amidohydrolase